MGWMTKDERGEYVPLLPHPKSNSRLPVRLLSERDGQCWVADLNAEHGLDWREIWWMPQSGEPAEPDKNLIFAGRSTNS